jgi:large subunit ribosomal protein L4e
VARIPRVGGSGTSRSGQGAFGNMCRKGRMFAPLKVWRRWHRKVNLRQKRHAVCSALAATAITPLVEARGHKIQNCPQIPLVVDDKVEGIEKTKDALAFLKKIGAMDDVKRVADSKNLRPGIGKLRNKRFRVRRGPLIIYGNENINLLRAVKNIPGVEITNVHRLNLKQLAPGGHLGRFVIWTKTAFASLNKVFGTFRKVADEKVGYRLHRTVVTNPDIAKIINSNAVQSVVRPARKNIAAHTNKLNPLKNHAALDNLNPYATALRRMEHEQQAHAKKARDEAIAKKRGFSGGLSKDQKKERTTRKKASKAWISNIHKQLDDSYPKPDEE